jgi:hypothetical protein
MTKGLLKGKITKIRKSLYSLKKSTKLLIKIAKQVTVKMLSNYLITIKNFEI